LSVGLCGRALPDPRNAEDHAMPAPRPALDPRAPLVLDTRELGRRPGAMRRVRRTVPAPDGWALELVRVPAGSDVHLDVRLESVMDGVLVSGTARATIAAECGRCLDPVNDELEVDLQELFAYDPAAAQDEELPACVGDFVDLEPTLRDAVVLSLPVNPVCDPDCAGLCVECGEHLADLPEDHTHDQIDPRWAALDALRESGGDNAREATREVGS
jgi:uncharacterized protein